MTPVDLKTVILVALLNPAVVAVSFWMGSRADQWQKVPVAAFAGAAVGLALVYVAFRLGLSGVAGINRAPAGVFAAGFLFGLVWAGLGYYFWRPRP